MVKETIVQIFIESGYDFITASSWATEFIKEVSRKPKGTYNYILAGRNIKIKRN